MNKISSEAIKKGWIATIDQLSHAFVTKLATLRLEDRMIQEVMPVLLKGYHLAAEHQLLAEQERLNKHNFYAIDKLSQLEEDITRPMLDMLSQLKVWTSKLTMHLDHSQSACACIHALLTQYPFMSEQQRQLVEFTEKHDFEFSCPSFFIEALVYHFLNRAMANGSEKEGKGSIRIWNTSDTQYSVMHFQYPERDACKIEATIFERFFDWNNILPGLGFCRLAVQYAGGDVTCHANEASMHFAILFPKNL